MFVPKKFAAPHQSSPPSTFTVRTSAVAQERDPPGEDAAEGKAASEENTSAKVSGPTKRFFRVSCMSLSFFSAQV